MDKDEILEQEYNQFNLIGKILGIGYFVIFLIISILFFAFVKIPI